MVSHGSKLTAKVAPEKIPPVVIFTDTETRELEGGQLSLLLGCYEIWAVDGKGMPRYQMAKGDYYTEAEFYSLLTSNLPCRVVAHNWNFDATVLRIGATDNMDTYGYTINPKDGIYPLPGQGFAPFLLTLQFEAGIAQLLCNTNFYKTSLASIGDSLGLPKMDMPETQDTTAMLEYCRNDVAILRAAFFAMFAYTQDIAGVTPGITAAMASNRVYRAGYYRGDKDAQGTQHIPYINEAERQAYHGGRTDTFFKGQPNDDWIYKYDVNSLYPYCMLGDMPVRYLQPGNESWVSGYRGYTILAHVTLYIPPESDYGFLGLEGVKHDGRLIFPVGRYTAWIWEPLLKIADRHNYIEAVHNVLVYECEPIFDTYIADLYARRQQYKESGNESFQMLTKLMMNSLYGKFGQRQSGKWEPVDPESNEYMVMAGLGDRFSQDWEGVEKDYWQMGTDLYAYTDGSGLARHSICSIAGYITAKGRAVLWNALAAVITQGGTLFMCDTDSIVCNIPLPPTFVHDTELGRFALEDTAPGSECNFYAPKHYLYKGKLKLKGVRKPTEGAVHPQDVFPNFTTDLMSANPNRRQRLQTGAIISRILKQPTGRNDKRVEIGDGLPTLPIVV